MGGWGGGRQDNEDHIFLVKIFQWPRWGRGFRKHLHFLPLFSQFLLHWGEKNLEWPQDWRNGGHLVVCEVSSTHIPIFQMRKVRFEEVGLTP